MTSVFFTTFAKIIRLRYWKPPSRRNAMDISGNPGRMPLAVGLKTSASFPVLIPATTLTCNQTKDPLNPYLHLIDGGLVDNQGIYTAFEVLRQDPATRKVLIIIDAYKGVSQPRSRWRASPSGPEMAGRIMKIALDSAHNRLKETITAQQQLTQAQSDAVDIEVILLSFSALNRMALRPLTMRVANVLR